MNSQCKTERLSADAQGLDRAIELLAAGAQVGIPTETVYGLAANAFDASAAAGIFAAKERPSFDPLIVHVPRAWQSCAALIEAGILAPAGLGPARQATMDALIRAFWPGPLTIVAPKSDLIPDVVTSGLPTVGVRMPDHPVTQVLLQRLGKPLAAPSANRFGRISPTTADHVIAELDGRIAAVLDGGRCPVGLESTIVELMPDGSITVLRPGGISVEALQEALAFALPGKALQVHVTRASIKHEGTDALKPSIQAPGQLEQHYAPSKRLLLFPPNTSFQFKKLSPEKAAELRGKIDGAVNHTSPSSAARKIGWLVQSGDPALHTKFLESALGRPVRVISLSAKGDEVEAARNLFAAMRTLDEDQTLSVIVAEPCANDTGLAFAINDRLRRASSRPW
ncbi:MAG: hypothetical protein RIQ81_1094 [Pseudomonadota bacterium]